MSMDPEVKAKWTAALRSGEYTQGKVYLAQVKDGVAQHCCLGVLCEIMGVEKQEVYASRAESYFAFSYDGHVDRCYLPQGFGAQVGIDSKIADLLVAMNDGDGEPEDDDYVRPRSFAEIADYIDEELW